MAIRTIISLNDLYIYCHSSFEDRCVCNVEIKTLSAVSFIANYRGLLVIADIASNTNTNKRRRTAADTLHISDLPAGFIADVSEYLPKPSRAILAVAFTSSSLWQNDNLMHRLSPISTAIILAQQWDILDFEDIEKELANKLTDNDISAVLKSINAQDVLKRLKLCGCINITDRFESIAR